MTKDTVTRAAMAAPRSERQIWIVCRSKAYDRQTLTSANVCADAPINAATPSGKAINTTRPRLRIAHIDIGKPVPAGTRAITFKIKLEAGKTRLQTWFSNNQGNSWSAYCLYVKRR